MRQPPAALFFLPPTAAAGRRSGRAARTPCVVVPPTPRREAGPPRQDGRRPTGAPGSAEARRTLSGPYRPAWISHRASLRGHRDAATAGRKTRKAPPAVALRAAGAAPRRRPAVTGLAWRCAWPERPGPEPARSPGPDRHPPRGTVRYPGRPVCRVLPEPPAGPPDEGAVRSTPGSEGEPTMMKSSNKLLIIIDNQRIMVMTWRFVRCARPSARS